MTSQTPSRTHRVMSTMWSDAPAWSRLVEVARHERPGSLGDLLTMLRMARRQDVVVLLGAVSFAHRYRDVVLAALLKWWPGRTPRVLVTDATWEPGSRALAARTGLPMSAFAPLARLMIAAVDGPHVRYAVLSSAEVETFPQVWGVDAHRVVFTPFPATIEADTPTTTGDYLFAGGNSLRDYDLLADALAGTGIRARVASRWTPEPPHDCEEIEAGPVSHEEFVALLAGCRAAVVPLERAVRSAGQQSYLNAMLLGKPVVVTDAPGVRDYIEDGVTGIVVEPTASALRAALERVMDPANAEEMAQMGARARARVLERFTLDHYFDDVLLPAAGVDARV